MFSTRYRFLAWATFCAVLASCLFLSGLGGGFIFDDRPNIQDNGALHLSELSADKLLLAAYSFQPGNGSRALSMLSFALDYWRGGGLDPAVFKTTNLVIHALTIFALALFFRRLLSLAQWPARRAACVALVLTGLWAIHPLQVSSVLYVVQRMQTLGTLFLVLALWAYLGARHAQIAEQRSHAYWALTGFFWALAFAAKEDSILFPAYALVLELTVLQFRAAQPAMARALRRVWMAAALVGAMAYFFVVLPHYWSWGDYPGRTFSSSERLLTQGRVLVMYLGQILLPLPERLPFFYDDLEISRSFLNPVSTLLALVLIGGLLAWAWRWRKARPVFSCGVLLFFAGHFMTSNVIGLELVFEHRNHFPLIGAVLALGDLCVAAVLRWRIPQVWNIALAAMVFVALGAGTLVRAHDWGEPLHFAQRTLEMAPGSERAWVALGGTYADLAAFRPDSAYLESAIATVRQGAEQFDSALLRSNVVNYKSIQGTATSEDWERFHQCLERVPMTVQNRNVIWPMIQNAQIGISMDARGVLTAMSILSRRTTYSPSENLQLASYALNDTPFSEEALPYLIRAVEQSPAGDAGIEQMLSALSESGWDEWVEQLSRIPRAPAK